MHALYDFSLIDMLRPLYTQRPGNWRGWVWSILTAIWRSIAGFFRGLAVVALFLGVLSGISLWKPFLMLLGRLVRLLCMVVAALMVSEFG